VQYTEQAITALEHLQTSVARLVERDGSTITPEEAWRVANDLEELACSLQYITVELESLPSRSRKNAHNIKVNKMLDILCYLCHN
jgi:hypothetical protein